MTSPQARKGRRAEIAVAEYLRTAGFDYAEPIDTFQAALDALQAHRATIAQLADTIESLATGADRAGRTAR